MRTMQNFNVYYVKLQYLLRLNTGKLQIVLHKIAIVLHYTTLHYIPFLDSYIPCTYEIVSDV